MTFTRSKKVKQTIKKLESYPREEQAKENVDLSEEEMDEEEVDLNDEFEYFDVGFYL